MLDSVTEGIIGVTHDGTIRFVSTSAEQALGIREQDVLGHPAQEIVGTEVADLVGHVVRAGAEVSRSRVDVSPTGAALVPMAVTVSPLVLPGEPRSAMVLVRDLRAEERQQRERMRSQAFAYGTLVSRSPRMQEVFDLVDQVAPTTDALIGDERARIRAALLSTQYRHGDAATMLGMHRTTLYRKRQKYGI